MMSKEHELTGWHVLAIFLGCFGVIIAVNIGLAISAVKSFPGLDVENSYVASQEFDARKEAQDALGWQTDVVYQNGEIRLLITDTGGKPVTPNGIEFKIGRATTAKFDQKLDMRFDGSAFSAPAELVSGKWLAFIDITAADGTAFHQTQDLWVKE